MKAIAYYRVSTEQQGRSGLGLEGQRVAVEQHCRSRGLEIIGEFTEIESGRNNARPELEKALRTTRLTQSVLVVAKLDRLSRDMAFLATLQAGDVRFVAADMPEANELTIHIMAAVAQAESRMISERTKAAMAVAKARGVKLGNPNGAMALHRPGMHEAAVAARVAKADRFAREVAPVITEIEAAGHTSLRAIAAELNRRRIGARCGGLWHPATVRDLLRRVRAA